MKICFSKGEHFFSTLYTLESKESLMWTTVLRGNNCYRAHVNKRFCYVHISGVFPPV